MQAFIQNVELFFELLLVAGVVIVGYVIWHHHKLAEAKRRREHAFAKQEESKALLATHQANLVYNELAMRQFQMQLASRVQQQGGTFEWTANNGFRASGVSIKQIDAPVQRPQIAAPVVDTAPRPLVLLSAYDLVDVFKRYEIGPDNIFMGVGMGKKFHWIDSKKGLCHGIFNAITGRGKTIVERGIEMQLLACNLEVWHMDIKFSLIDENGLDYRPIAQRLLAQPDTEIEGKRVSHLITNPEQIRDSLKWVAETDIPRRLAMYRRGDHSYSVFYMFLEELLYLLKLFPEIAGYIETIIVVGRSLGVKLFTAAQNFQAQNTNISGGMRDNFETAIYLGGDDVSGAKILDMRQKELTDYLSLHDAILGKGVTMFRNNTIAPKAELVRTGMASNDALYYLLGRADDFVLPEMVGMRERHTDPAQNVHIHAQMTSPIEQRVHSITGALVKDVKPLEKIGESFPDDVKNGESLPAFTLEQERQVIAIAQTMLKTKGRVIRSEIPALMTPPENNRFYPAVKYICNREGW